MPTDERHALAPFLESVPLRLGQTLYEAGGEQAYVYFPTDSIISLLYVLENGASAEIAVTGNEGVVGISLFMGGETMPAQAVVQSAGSAYRLKASIIKKEFGRGGLLQHALLRFTQALIIQMAQTAVCNRHHSVDQQLCRWLLLSLDRLRSQSARDDARADCQHARRASRRCDRGRGQAACRRADQLSPRPHRRCGPGEGWRNGCANAMQW